MTSTSSALRSDSELLSGVSVGTFRWKKDKTFIDLPVPTSNSTQFELRGWGPYLTSRAGASFVQTVRQDLATIDALSFPLSLLFALDRLALTPTTFQQQHVNALHIVIAGATAHAEQRLLFDTNYWSEVGHVYKDIPNIHLHFVGPEAASLATLRKSFTTVKNNNNSSSNKKKGKKKKRSKGKPIAPRVAKNTKVDHFRGTATAFFKENPTLLESGVATVVVGFNPGFGSGNAPIVASWTKDLLSLADTGVPIIFTQANDYSDLLGELLILQQIVGTKFVMTPTRNAFPMATTAHEPGRRESWSCGNSFVYAMQGWSTEETKRRSTIFSKEPRTFARSLAQVVALQQQMDKRGGIPPGMSGGGRMPQIRMRVEEVGPLKMEWTTQATTTTTTMKITAANGNPEENSVAAAAAAAAPKVQVKVEVKVLEENVEDVSKVQVKVAAATPTETKPTNTSRRSKKEIAAHRSFMEELGRTAKARGFMPDMGVMEEYKESREKEEQEQEQKSQPVQNAVEVVDEQGKRRVDVPSLALELDY